MKETRFARQSKVNFPGDFVLVHHWPLPTPVTIVATDVALPICNVTKHFETEVETT